jgi:hypothetical protein
MSALPVVPYVLAMPRYFFHVYNDETTIDREGKDLADLDAAKREAMRGARDLMAEAVRHGEVTMSHRIEVEDDGGRPLLTIRYADAVLIRP